MHGSKKDTITPLLPANMIFWSIVKSYLELNTSKFNLDFKMFKLTRPSNPQYSIIILKPNKAYTPWNMRQVNKKCRLRCACQYITPEWGSFGMCAMWRYICTWTVLTILLVFKSITHTCIIYHWIGCVFSRSIQNCFQIENIPTRNRGGGFYLEMSMYEVPVGRILLTLLVFW